LGQDDELIGASRIVGQDRDSSGDKKVAWRDERVDGLRAGGS
jgi:hypothetical protein